MNNISDHTHKAIDIKNGEKAVPYSLTSFTSFSSTFTGLAVNSDRLFNFFKSSLVESIELVTSFLAVRTPLFSVLAPFDRDSVPLFNVLIANKTFSFSYLPGQKVRPSFF